MDLATSERILPALPDGVKGVAESGVRTAADARRLRRAGAANLLVGEALVRAAGSGPAPGRAGGSRGAAMSAPVLVKICGITRLEDALAAARLGADWVGFNFWPRSRRYITPEAAAAIVAALPALGPAGGRVRRSRAAAELARAVQLSGVRTVQLHGDEHPDAVRRRRRSRW